MSDISEKISNWIVSMGYATGSPAHGTDGWSVLVTTTMASTPVSAVEDNRKMGFSMSGDICADWIFSITDADGNSLGIVEQAEIEKLVVENLKASIEG